MTNQDIHQQLSKAFDQRDRTNGSGVNVLVLVELNEFKRISVGVGLETAEILAAAFHERIRDFLRPCDAQLVISDEQSAAVLTNIQSMHQLDLAAAKLFRQFENPVDLIDTQVQVKIHAAFVVPKKARTGAAELLDEAERGLLNARGNDRCYTVVRLGENQPEASDDWQAQQEIETAFEQGEFRLFFQPKIHAAYRSTVGAEALLYWASPEHGLTGPDSFMGSVEHSAILKPVTWFCIRSAAATCRNWPADTGVAVNIATQALVDDEIVQVLRDAVGFYELGPNRLTIEVMEGAMSSDPGRCFAILERIRGLGVRVSIDNFGTGYSSLAHFRELPADELKIDRSFVTAMADNPRDVSLVRSIIDIAHNFDLQVVAGGIKDERAADTMRDLDCDVLQGPLFGEPCESRAFAAYLEGKPT